MSMIEIRLIENIREKRMECIQCGELVTGHLWILDVCEHIGNLALCPQCVAKANTALVALKS